jgi:hypothetical protein
MKNSEVNMNDTIFSPELIGCLAKLQRDIENCSAQLEKLKSETSKLESKMNETNLRKEED